ncbi:MAG: penicillin-binding protein 2 [Oscillospiraceae bacterium]
MTEKRLLLMFSFFTAFAFLIELNMVYVNISGDYYTDAKNQQFKDVYVTDGRAQITDNNFNNITNTQTQLKALITSNQSDLQSVFESLSEKDKQEFYDKLQSSRSFLTDVETPIEGEMVFEGTNRYSDFNMAQHLIGYLDAQGNGASGLEKAFDKELKNAAQRLRLKLEINGYGDILKVEKQMDNVESSSGSTFLALTIDNTIQRICEAIAKEYIPNGSIVVMESKTGKIKAMASTPFYNPNKMEQYLTQAQSPLVNKALQAYEPGSVIKPLWASVLLENGYNPKKEYECVGYIDVNGHKYHCANNTPHGKVDMERALVVSCNCYFVNAYIEDKGAKYNQTGNAINFGKNLELTKNYYTARGYFPDLHEISNLGQLASVSFGQGKFLLTPLHVTSYINIFANEGKYVLPQIAQGIYTSQDKELRTNLYNLQEQQIFDIKVSNQVKDMLKLVVEDGAKGNAKPSYLAAGGKTGTAQTGKKNEDGTEIFTAWFCGFYPFDNPQYTICVTMYNGGESTKTAAPIFKKICDSLYYIL